MSEPKKIYGKDNLRIDEMAKFLNISKRLAYGLVASGSLKAFKVGGCLRVTSESVLEFIEKQSASYEEENGFISKNCAG